MHLITCKLLTHVQVLSGQPKPPSISIVHRILRGSDLSRRNHKGQNILFEAIREKMTASFMENLLQYGADLAARDHYGRTACDYAEEHEHDECIACFDDYVFDLMVKRNLDEVQGLVLRGYDHIWDLLIREESRVARLNAQFDDDHIYQKIGHYVKGIPKIQVDLKHLIRSSTCHRNKSYLHFLIRCFVILT